MTRIITRLSMLLLVVASLAASSNVLAQANATQEHTTKNEKPTTSASKSTKILVPVFSLDRPVLESPVVQDPFFGAMGAETIKDLVARLEKARDDGAVKAVVILLGNTTMGTGQLEELNRSLRQFRDVGMPVYAHADGLSFSRLALLSAASRISVAPVGDLFITGLYGEQPHIRELLEKIHVTPDFITCGAYKSAA